MLFNTTVHFLCIHTHQLSTHAHMQVHTHAHAHAHTHTQTHTDTHTHIHTHIHTQTHTHIHRHTDTHTHTHTHTHIHRHTHAHTHARTHTRTHTHTHARTHASTHMHAHTLLVNKSPVYYMSIWMDHVSWYGCLHLVVLYGSPFPQDSTYLQKFNKSCKCVHNCDITSVKMTNFCDITIDN